MSVRETRVLRQIRAPVETVYNLLLDPRAVAAWKVPDDMTCHVHTFEPWEGGSFRISLTYVAPGHEGKSSASTDTYHGTFVKLARDTEIVEKMRFETGRATMDSWMTVTYQLRAADINAELLVLHAGVPESVALRDNELGWSMALAKLASLAEDTGRRPEQGAA